MRRYVLAPRAASIALAGLLALSPLTLAGCDQQQPTTPAESDAQQTESKDPKATDGKGGSAASNEGKDAQATVTADMGKGDTLVSLTNSLGFDISSIAVKDAAAQDFDATNSFDGVELADGGTKTLAYASVQGASGYDLRLGVGPDSYFLVRDVDLANAKDVRLLMDEGVAYVSYTDATTGEERNNHDEVVAAAMDPDLPTYDKETQRD